MWCVLRHLVQILTRFGAPFTVIVSLWVLGRKRVLVRRLEWLTLFPDIPTLPQTSHFMIDPYPFDRRSGFQ